VGFVVVPPDGARRILIGVGYYYILAVTCLFAWFAWRVLAARRAVWLAWLRRPGAVGAALLAGAVFSVWADAFHHKILFDEYVLEGTAWHMHAVKEVSTPMRAYEISGSWLAIDAFLDKRPLFFPFLISVLHDLTGFRVTNAFVLNVILSPIVLGLLYWLARTLTSRGPALIAMALMATLPLFGQNVTGASMELLNLAMIAMTAVAAVLYLRAPDADRVSLLVVSTALLAQCRYESALFVVPVALVVLIGWIRAGELVIPWAVVAGPWLLVPYAWHNRVVTATPILWQLREGETSRFSVQYLPGNLEGAWRFFFGTTPALPGSWWLSALGGVGLVWAGGWLLWRRWCARGKPLPPLRAEVVAIGVFGLAIVANLALVMFYYWSRLDEPIASRFALPALFLLAIAGGWAVYRADRRGWPGTRFAVWGLAAWLLVWGAPAYAKRGYTEVNQVMHEVEWELDQLRAREGPLLFITNKGTMPYLLEHIPTLNLPAIFTRASQIAWHMREGTFHEVLIAQVIRPTSIEGDLGVDPADATPENFKLEPLTQKRFGGRWIRISRVVKIETETEAKSGD
jgi:hypothetical protein